MLVVGAVHGHSRYSDGRGTVEEIRAAAQAAGLDFLILTDHDTLRPLAEVGEAFCGRTLSLFGCEVSPPTNHLLVFGAERCPDRSRAPQEYLDDAAAQGALTFLAHPHDRGVPLAHIPAYPWEAWPLEEFTGLEVWNQLSDFAGHLGGLSSAIRALRRPHLALQGPEPETLALWDALGRERRVVGLAGLDVHDIHIGRPPLGLRIFPYDYAMRTLLCYVDVAEWSEDAQTAKVRLLEAFAAGRLHFAHHGLADARDVRFAARLADGAELPMGAEHPWQAARELALRSPEPAELRLLRDGETAAESFGRELAVRPDGPGVYRAELRLRRDGRSLPWAFTNPIYLRP